MAESDEAGTEQAAEMAPSSSGEARHIDGYTSSIDYDDVSLTITAKSGLGRGALKADARTIRFEEVTARSFSDAKALTNGRIEIGTVQGKTVFHFLRGKQQQPARKAFDFIAARTPNASDDTSGLTRASDKVDVVGERLAASRARLEANSAALAQERAAQKEQRAQDRDTKRDEREAAKLQKEQARRDATAAREAAKEAAAAAARDEMQRRADAAQQRQEWVEAQIQRRGNLITHIAPVGAQPGIWVFEREVWTGMSVGDPNSPHKSGSLAGATARVEYQDNRREQAATRLAPTTFGDTFRTTTLWGGGVNPGHVKAVVESHTIGTVRQMGIPFSQVVA